MMKNYFFRQNHTLIINVNKKNEQCINIFFQIINFNLIKLS
jgi:hypothetical protein